MILTDANFDASINQATKPVLVKFSAPWCAPCKAMDPLLEDVAKQGEVIVASLDIEQNPKTSAELRVRSLPTLIIFKNGKPHATSIGAMSRTALSVFVSKRLKS